MCQRLLSEELTFDSIKRILTENNNIDTIEQEKRVQFSKLFRNAPFHDLVKKTQPKVRNLSNIYYLNLYLCIKHFNFIE
jgi:hypothetical protein